jgi:16S rRNA (cytosine967-C5)-methyltransferase
VAPDPAPSEKPIPRPRRVALDVVARALSPTGHGFARDLLNKRLAGVKMKPEDRRLAQELAYGVIRRLATLDALLAAYSSQPPAGLEPEVLHVLRQGAYQLLFMERVPAHAAVDESVRLVRSVGKARAAGYVNAVLRNIGRELAFEPKADPARPRRSFEIAPGRACRFGRDVLPDPADEVARAAAVHSFPEALVRRWFSRFGREQAETLMACANRPAPIFLRPNELRTDLAGLAEALRAEGVETVTSPSGRTLRLPAHAAAPRLKAFREGLCAVQDDSSAAVAPFLEARPGDRIADLCAAPGGKSCQLAEQMRNEGILAAVDVSARRLERVMENTHRLGITIIAPVEADALEFCAQHPAKFDRLLLDAPCSNSGVLRRRVEARWRFTEDSLREIARKQGELLRAALAALRPGGALVYSTCSLEPEENALLVAATLSAAPGFRLDAHREILPSDEGGDGTFMARVVRSLPEEA